MQVIEKKIQSQKSKIIEFSSILIKCPVCKSEKMLKFPKSVINQGKQLTTVSIPKGLVCKHHFQVFIDKNHMVRGYQKVDFEYAHDLINSKKLTPKESNNKDKGFSEYIIIEENYIAYKPKGNQIIIERNYNSNDPKKTIEINVNNIKSKNMLANFNPKINAIKKIKMSLEEIYNQFWDFIDENNEVFQIFIDKDPRRENITMTY